MRFLGDVVAWFADGEHWQGPGGVPHRLAEHLHLSGVSLAVALLIALPAGLVLGHTGRGGALAVNVSNVGRALPSFAILVVTVQITGIGATPAYVALVALAVPPILTNTYVGMREVDADVKEAAHGMGMTGRQRLTRIEARRAVPRIRAGGPPPPVQVVATATLAAVVASGGLGRYIVDGFATQDHVQIFAGALLVAGLSLVVEAALALVESRWRITTS
jgi:osmoprotectant transport system permease protein